MVTDIAILVVAAEDGIKPQTIESINHAKAAEIPIIVAINKMDKPEANPDRVKQQLTEYGLVCEEWGGETIVCPISAKTGMGVDNLLEMLTLTAEVEELKANPNRAAQGTVIEARLDKGRGPVATLLVQNGTLHQSDIIIAGTSVGRIRAMVDDKGRRLKDAGPSVPVEITGLAEVPSAGCTFNAVADELKSEGYELKVVEYNDYVQPNVALDAGDLDANYFQHLPYLENYNDENGTDLVSAGAVHFEPMGLYAGKSSDINNVPDGAKIAVPSDATNEARALLLLQDQGVIKLKDGVGLEATANDIEENPHNIQLVEVEAAAVPRSLEDSDFAVINGNYALSAGLDTSATLASESADSEAAQTYANIVAVRKGDENSEKTQALIKALTSDTARKFIEEQYKGSVIPVF